MRKFVCWPEITNHHPANIHHPPLVMLFSEVDSFSKYWCCHELNYPNGKGMSSMIHYCYIFKGSDILIFTLFSNGSYSIRRYLINLHVIEWYIFHKLP